MTNQFQDGYNAASAEGRGKLLAVFVLGFIAGLMTLIILMQV